MRKLAMTLICAAAMQGAAQVPASNPVSIQVDLAKPQGPYTPIYAWFGYDESNYTTMKYGKQLLRELHDLSPVPVTIRTHHLLTSGNGVAELKWGSSNVFTVDANRKPVYDFTITDQTFDEFQKAGVRPMVELGFMPKDLAATVAGVAAYQVHYPANTTSGASNNPPEDYVLWGELVRRYTEHLVGRYGKQEVSRWYFEVWNNRATYCPSTSPRRSHNLLSFPPVVQAEPACDPAVRACRRSVLRRAASGQQTAGDSRMDDSSRRSECKACIHGLSAG